MALLTAHWPQRQLPRAAWLARGLTLVVAALLATAPAMAQIPDISEYQAKAAFLYNFTKFVEWPPTAFADAAAPLSICVLGEDPFGQHLDAAAQLRTQGRPLRILRIADGSAATSCHVLFVAAPETRRLPQILTALRQHPVLLVGDVPNFAEDGGAINLILVDNRIRMEINVEAAQDHGLRISARLLRLARIVRKSAG